MAEEQAEEEANEAPQDEMEPEGADGEGAGGDEDGEDAEENLGGFDVKKIVLFVVLPIVLLLAIGGGLYFTGMLDSFFGEQQMEVMLDEYGDPVLDEHGEPVMVTVSGDGHAEGDEHGDDGHGSASKTAAFLEIPTMIVNLASNSGTPRYLRLSVQLELESQADLASVEAVIPRVVDQFQTYLRELRVKDLRGSAGIYRLQMELLWRVNQAAAPVEVKDVLFQEILIQ